MTELLERIAADVGGRYVVERELGRGGMATVYLARDLRDESRVAIKVMDPELAAAVGAERFKREIEVASRLKHPHILGILDSGEAAGTSYYVMPFVKGETLRDRMEREKELPIEDAIRIARDVADALAYAHEQGVVHRDIKPENILLEDGHVLVADFGIARAASEADNKTLTKTGVALGTPHYMSPEQVMGEKGIDGRTDQYALGCMLYEMLVGMPPFVGPHAQSLMVQHVMEEPPLVSKFRPTAPQNVEDAVWQALRKKAADRFPTLRDFNVALENTGYTSLMKITALQRLPTPATLPAMAPRPLWKRALPLAAGLVLAVGAGFGVYAFAGQRGAAVDPALLAEQKRIAVLYFDAVGGGDVPALAEGLTEGLIARLREVNALTVVGRSGVLPYRGSSLGADSIARALGVGTVATGTVERTGATLQVTVRLRDKSGTPLGDPVVVRRDTAEAFALRDAVAADVAARLARQLRAEIAVAQARAGTSNPQAFTLHQRGERARRTADSLAAARRDGPALAQLDDADAQFRQAAALDPRWSTPVAARAGIALARIPLLAVRAEQAAWLDSAERLASQALAVNGEDGDAFTARGSARALRLLNGFVPDDQFRTVFGMAAADLDTATLLDSRNASAFNMRGRLEYAEKNVQKARMFTLDAYKADQWLAEAPQVLERLFYTSHDLNDYEGARQYCEEGARRFPTQARFVECRLIVQTMPRAEGVTAQTVWSAVDSLRQRVDSARWAGVRSQYEIFAAAALIRAGLPDSARRVMERAVAAAPASPHSEMPAYQAFVLTQLGDREAAIRLIERYVGEQPQHVAGFDRADFWWWQPLKQDPRFNDVMNLAKRRLQASR